MSESQDQDDALPNAPEGLNERGREFWNAMQLAVLEDDAEFDTSETAALEEACRVLDTIGQLSNRVDRDGYTVTGSRGQIVVHPAVQEIRLQQTTLARLLGIVKLPEDPKERERWLISRAKAGAAGRWEKRRG
ncbi:P27 family phage terminase small subunit [Microbacterium sp. E-13]|uniref:P27 family phage terminase small subunit n=1 Tax=Microbacterium sp. E-13 TaxID=3404048 RepID=UPI003CEF67F6